MLTEIVQAMQEDLIQILNRVNDKGFTILQIELNTFSEVHPMPPKVVFTLNDDYMQISGQMDGTYIVYVFNNDWRQISRDKVIEIEEVLGAIL